MPDKPEMFDIDALRGNTPATIRAAFNNSEEICEEHGDMGDGRMGGTNVSSILTRIVQDAGRFSERWASDVLYGMDTIDAMAHKPFAYREPFDEIISFGLRQDGVDCSSYIMHRLRDTRSMPCGYVYPHRDYRRILAVRLRAWADENFHCVRTDFSLRDITNAIHHMDPADLKENGYDVVELPRPDKKNPEPEEHGRVDKAGIEKLKKDGYTSFRYRILSVSELAEDGCKGGIRSAEVYGLYPEPVPEPKDPKDQSVCRVYRTASDETIACWTDRWYVGYREARKTVDAAMAALED